MPKLVHFAVVAIVAVSAAVTPARAQSTTRPSIAIYAGGDRTIISGDSMTGPLHRTNFVGGASLLWPISGMFSMEPSVEFAEKGTKSLDRTPSGAPFQWEVSVNYIEFPILARATLGHWGAVTPVLLLGPEVAFKAGCALAAQGGDRPSYTCANLSAGIETVDFGVIGGGGLDFRIGRQVLTTSVRYDYGLRDAFKDNDAKNRSLDFVVGVRW